MKNILSLLLLFSFICNAQKKLIVYFDTNVSSLNNEELNKIDKIFSSKNYKVNSVIGYCDSRANSSYNDTLALKRANFVAQILQDKFNQSDFQVKSKGENFTQNKDLSKNRKVEISYSPIVSKVLTVISLIDLKPTIETSNIGDKIILKKVNFLDRTAILYPESEPILDELVSILKNNPKYKIEIQGHICCTPGPDNEEFALKRCKAVYNYLIKNGIKKENLQYKSFDATQPLFPIPEKNEEQRKANRRIEILILEK